MKSFLPPSDLSLKNYFRKKKIKINTYTNIGKINNKIIFFKKFFISSFIFLFLKIRKEKNIKAIIVRAKPK